MPVASATQEAEAKRLKVQGQPGNSVRPCLKVKLSKGLGWSISGFPKQVQGPGFTPENLKKSKVTDISDKLLSSLF